MHGDCERRRPASPTKTKTRPRVCALGSAFGISSLVSAPCSASRTSTTTRSWSSGSPRLGRRRSGRATPSCNAREYLKSCDLRDHLTAFAFGSAKRSRDPGEGDRERFVDVLTVRRLHLRRDHAGFGHGLALEGLWIQPRLTRLGERGLGGS